MANLLPYTVPTEAVQHAEPNVVAILEENNIGNGTLFITESCVLWLNSNAEGIQLEYKLITLHAISRELRDFPGEHLLLHYEGKLPGLIQQGSQSESSEEEGHRDTTESEVSLTEIKFAPTNKESLERMFEALAQCQTLHPDDDCQLSADDDFEDAEGDENEFYHNEDGEAHLNEEGRANLERLNQLLQAGQGDADITARTNQIHLSNGHHEIEADMQQDGQFQDADGMDDE